MSETTFEEWLREVDQILYREVGLGHSDLEDYCWWSCYNIGDEPSIAVESFMEDILNVSI